MKQEIDANDALQAMIHLLAHNLATTRKLADIVIATMYAGNPPSGVAAMQSLREESDKEMQNILDKIYENYGKIDLDGLLGESPKD